MISFLPTQCMIFSIRFVVQSAKDFHPCKPIQKAATSHAKQKRQRFHPYRLMFILSNADDTTSTRRFFYSNLCIELFRQCGLIPIMQSSNAKQKRYSFHPYRLMFIFSQHRRHDCRRAFFLLEFVHRIAPPMRTHEK